MKKFLLLCLFAVFSISCFAQSSTMLTKDETISYIKKKVEAINGEIVPTNSEGSERLKAVYFVAKEDLLEFSYTQKIHNDWTETVYFNPALITDINIWSCKKVVCGLNIFVKNGSAMHKSGENKYRTQNVAIYFINDHPENGNRIKKALLHLRDLYRAKEDPFDN